MHISGRDWHDLLYHRHARDVAARSQVDSRRHGAVFVHSQEVFGCRYGRGAFREEFSSDVPVLDCNGLGVIADDVQFGVVGFRAPDGGFDEGHAVDVFGLGGGYAECVFALFLRGDGRGQRQALGGMPSASDGRGGGYVASEAHQCVYVSA